MLQKCALECENAPHWEQNRPAFTGTILTGMYLSAEQAQINATNQPMTVQPASRFTRRIPIKSALCRAKIVGRKYRIAERNRKVMFSPLSALTQLAETPSLTPTSRYRRLPEIVPSLKGTCHT
jgi:hypothetical protein